MSNAADAISLARQHPAVLSALREILAQAERDVVAMGLSCEGCGHCCDFAAAGHRLYASTAEIALVLSAGNPADANELRCGYQQDGLCLARDVRPLGCRMYFCNEDHRDFQALYETTHQAIRELHRSENIPYFYVELTGILRQYRKDAKD
ncbi:MAG: hypothetical protein HN909_07330 [Phycisphaerales bacterium]|jgi:Fe-S-cluster containining protein|nr:hypothetical protein [Phycisphaerales bacterium]MBT7171564.1 hypothetical protein [Phycisphaerales bacterium]